MLVIHVLFVFLAAFGLFCAVWAMAGFWLPRCRKGRIFCTEKDFVPVYLWLRGMGIVNCSLCLLDQNLSQEERDWLTLKEIERYEEENA